MSATIVILPVVRRETPQPQPAARGACSKDEVRDSVPLAFERGRVEVKCGPLAVELFATGAKPALYFLNPREAYELGKLLIAAAYQSQDGDA